ncbi:MAG: hypothetical protein ACFE7R_06285 [Candidatus Hodarchaeota archaeon]
MEERNVWWFVFCVVVIFDATIILLNPRGYERITKYNVDVQSIPRLAMVEGTHIPPQLQEELQNLGNEIRSLMEEFTNLDSAN